MALNLYRRHRRDCKSGHPEDHLSSEFDERKKGWSRCECPIFASGTLARKYKRQSTGQWQWTDARAAAAQWEEKGSWDINPISAPRESSGHAKSERITLVDALDAFTAHRKNHGVSIATLKKYATFTRQVLHYAESRGYVMIDQLTVTDMDRFYASWKDGIRSKAKKLERLKGFIKFCMKRKWLAENITDDLEAPQGSSIPPDKMPFTDEELNRIYKACDAMGGPTPPGPGHRPWGGEDAKDFVMLSVYTGLRISDVATFDITNRLKGNDIFLRMHKTRKELFTWIPDWLVERLRERERVRGALIFRAGQSMVVRAMAERWRRQLDQIFKLAGPFVQRPTPHRFRHTFVRILLENGVPVADAAELIGDTEDVLRKHYAKWVPERQARLTRVLQDAFGKKNKPQLIAINGGKVAS